MPETSSTRLSVPDVKDLAKVPFLDKKDLL